MIKRFALKREGKKERVGAGELDNESVWACNLYGYPTEENEGKKMLDSLIRRMREKVSIETELSRS